MGVSTTELVGRMLLLTRDHHHSSSVAAAEKEDIKSTDTDEPAEKRTKVSPYTAGAKMMPSNHRLVQFSQPIREPKAGDKIVYVDGSFDLFRTKSIHLPTY